MEKLQQQKTTNSKKHKQPNKHRHKTRKQKNNNLLPTNKLHNRKHDKHNNNTRNNNVDKKKKCENTNILKEAINYVKGPRTCKHCNLHCAIEYNFICSLVPEAVFNFLRLMKVQRQIISSNENKIVKDFSFRTKFMY